MDQNLFLRNPKRAGGIPRIGKEIRAAGPSRPVDRTDRILLRALLQDGRASYSALANRLGLTDNGVRYRVENLRRQGAIRGFTIRTDPVALQRPLGVTIRLETLPENLELVAAHLRRIPQLHQIYALASRANLLAVGHFRDAKELAAVLNEDFKIPEIKSHEVDIITSVVREEPLTP